MLVHLRLTLPTELTDPTVAVLLNHDWVTNVVRQDGVSLVPTGDLVGRLGSEYAAAKARLAA